MNKTFESYFPAQCPPEDVHECSGTYFRMVRNDPASTSDFLTHHETKRMPRADACLRCGLSIFEDSEDAERTYLNIKKSYPDVPFPHLIARIKLTPDAGVIKQTNQPSHHTWWPFVDTDRAAVCGEIIKDMKNDVET